MSDTPRTDALLQRQDYSPAQLLQLCRELERSFSEEIQKWIPVSERLPEPQQDVLAWEPASSLRYTIACYGAISRTRNTLASHGWIDSAGEIIDVSHWMPLPEAPK